MFWRLLNKWHLLLIAKLIHDGNNKGEFIPVNSAALPSTLLENLQFYLREKVEQVKISELFGYEKGTFTGANENRKGRFELADNGTIFLDEISEIDL